MVPKTKLHERQSFRWNFFSLYGKVFLIWLSWVFFFFFCSTKFQILFIACFNFFPSGKKTKQLMLVISASTLHEMVHKLLRCLIVIRVSDFLQLDLNYGSREKCGHWISLLNLLMWKEVVKDLFACSRLDMRL